MEVGLIAKMKLNIINEIAGDMKIRGVRIGKFSLLNTDEKHYMHCCGGHG
jgi:hypothetical protein